MNTLKLLFLTLLMTAGMNARGQAPDWSTLAKKIVNETAGIQSGEVVIIEGGSHTLPLMEQIAAEVHRKGGMPEIIVQSDITLKALWREKPKANLSDYPTHKMALYSKADYVIQLPASKDFKSIYEGVDPKRFTKAAENNEKMMQELSSTTHYSDIVVGFPTKQIAEANGIDFKIYEKMHWAAANADAKAMSVSGEIIKELLTGAKKVRITTKAGTDISFAMGDRLAFADDGILTKAEKDSDIMFARYAFLPGGWMDFAPKENTANGKVVVPLTRCEYNPMKDVSFDIENGIMKNFKAKEGGDCFKKNMAASTGDKDRISVLTLGLNPELKVIQKGETDYRPNSAAGMMYISFGGNNSQYGGTTVAAGGFGFPLVNATLEIDGQTVIKGGKLLK